MALQGDSDGKDSKRAHRHKDKKSKKEKKEKDPERDRLKKEKKEKKEKKRQKEREKDNEQHQSQPEQDVSTCATPVYGATAFPPATMASTLHHTASHKLHAQPVHIFSCVCLLVHQKVTHHG